jgi:hypothetical protein
MKNLLIIIFCFAIFPLNCFSFSFEKFAKEFSEENNSEKIYTISLENGDVLSGFIIEIINYQNNSSEKNPEVNKENPDEENINISNIILKTSFDEIIIYEDEVINISEKKISIHPNHSMFIMPTANPISDNHFIGNYELAVFYGGIGITDWVSITGGGSILPSTNLDETYFDDQISLINAKVSFPKIGAENSSNVVLALGANLGWLGDNNKMLHLFALGTYNSKELSNSSFTAGLFYKLGYQDYPSTIYLLDRGFAFDYQDGAFGICAGFDHRFRTRSDLALVMEVWNSDVTRPTNTAILLGLRLAGRNFTSTFGIMASTQPFAFPFVSFCWSPFN